LLFASGASAHAGVQAVDTDDRPDGVTLETYVVPFMSQIDS
jgi:hypothetical protein